MPAGAITLFHVRGIRISVDWSWFLILFLIIFSLSGFYEDVTNAPQDSFGPYALAVISALLFFGSILLHELGHAVVAIRRGIGISGITLWLFGGIAQLERDTDSPGTEFKVAVAGPAVTALIILVGGGIGIALSGVDDFTEAMLINESAPVSEVAAVLGWITFVNLWLLGFNLIPAFPLDGGRIARALVWWRTGDRTKATRVAATLGRGFAYILFGLAIFLFIDGDIFSAVWIGFLGFILNGSARGAVAQSELTRSIEGVSVSDVMDREPVAIPEGLPIERALDEYFLRYGYPWFPVVDERERFVGLIDQGAAQGIPATEQTAATVGDILARDSGTASVSEDSPLEALLGNQALRRLGALAAVDSDGRLRGMITLDAVGRALRPPTPLGPTTGG